MAALENFNDKIYPTCTQLNNTFLLQYNSFGDQQSSDKCIFVVQMP